MSVADFLMWLPTAINKALDVSLPWVAIALFLGIDIWFFIKNREKIKSKKMQVGEFSNQLLILLGVEIITSLVFWLLPALIYKVLPWGLLRDILRWAIFGGILYFIIYIYGHENGEHRWRNSTFGHLAILLLGFFIGRWVGILFFSLPVFASYYIALYQRAMVILPTSNPEDKNERLKRFIVLAAYTWGIQFPIMVVGEHAWKKPEVRIPGDFTRDFKVPGFIWTKSHQVVAITGGTQFKRVDGPGMVFMGKLERPLQIVDLRLQLRTNEIDVISKDGIHFKARVFTAFRMDQETWDKETYSKLRMANPLLRGADNLSYTQGSFPFSHLRVQAAMGITSSKVVPNDISIFWDQWALGIVENQARTIISQKNLDELWKPQNDKKLANALEVIAKELKENVFMPLRAAGILVYAARVVNFRFENEENAPEKSITKRQIESWGAEWERKRKQILAEAEAEASRAQQEARAYAESQLLKSIAEGLERTEEIHPRLSRYIIAMRFLSSLEDFVTEKPEVAGDDKQKNKIADLQNYLRDWQTQFFPPNNKEKEA